MFWYNSNFKYIVLLIAQYEVEVLLYFIINFEQKMKNYSVLASNLNCPILKDLIFKPRYL